MRTELALLGIWIAIYIALITVAMFLTAAGLPILS